MCLFYVSATFQGLHVRCLFSKQTSHLLFYCSGNNSQAVVECYKGRDTRIKGKKNDAICGRLGPWRNRRQDLIRNTREGFPGGAVVKNPPASAGDTGSSPGLGRSHMPWSNEARVPQLLRLRS